MKIKIDKHIYKIQEVEKASEELTTNDPNEAWGRCNYTKRTIYLRKDLDLYTKRKTLIHELTHAFIEAYGFYQVDFNNEIVCDFLGNYASEIINISNKYFGDKNE